MRAMVLERRGEPLRERPWPRPRPSGRDVLLRVQACGVCRTDVHLVDGELPEVALPLIPGHQIVGRVIELGDAATRLRQGDRVGVPWLGWTCGSCAFCRSDQENLCDQAQCTGYQRHGGFAELAVADERWCFPLPAETTDEQVAPLLCAGLIGYRALRMTGAARCLGFFGFGAAAHILVQVARHEGRESFAFTRPGDAEGQRFATELGATWAGDSTAATPRPLDAAIIFAPVGALVATALRAVRKGGVVVCAGIHMSELPAMPYDLLWGERVLRSVANLTRRDGEELLALASRVPIRTTVEVFPLAGANDALAAIRDGTLRGAAVLRIGAG
ncbi:MAG: zinc-dependent alcohol dehydrogenase family protein [Proteobacteria bacterium]|nr:zinc-dependent alcohol dehydrogenase family protein [Pseudomonadota bacterium]